MDGEEPAAIRIVRTREEFHAAGRLLRAYRRWLETHRDVTNFEDAILQRGLAYFDAELQRLPVEYGAPTGAFLIAWVGGRAVGCAGVRRQGDGVAEIKRVFLRPSARGRGLGYRLTRSALRSARRLGYRRAILDTLPTMTAAIALYRRMGFRPIPAYWPHPVPGALFFEYALD